MNEQHSTSTIFSDLNRVTQKSYLHILVFTAVSALMICALLPGCGSSSSSGQGATGFPNVNNKIDPTRVANLDRKRNFQISQKIMKAVCDHAGQEQVTSDVSLSEMYCNGCPSYTTNKDGNSDKKKLELILSGHFSTEKNNEAILVLNGCEPPQLGSNNLIVVREQDHEWKKVSSANSNFISNDCQKFTSKVAPDQKDVADKKEELLCKTYQYAEPTNWVELTRISVNQSFDQLSEPSSESSKDDVKKENVSIVETPVSFKFTSTLNKKLPKDAKCYHNDIASFEFIHRTALKDVDMKKVALTVLLRGSSLRAGKPTETEGEECSEKAVSANKSAISLIYIFDGKTFSISPGYNKEFGISDKLLTL